MKQTQELMSFQAQPKDLTPTHMLGMYVQESSLDFACHSDSSMEGCAVGSSRSALHQLRLWPRRAQPNTAFQVDI